MIKKKKKKTKKKNKKERVRKSTNLKFFFTTETDLLYLKLYRILPQYLFSTKFIRT